MLLINPVNTADGSSNLDHFFVTNDNCLELGRGSVTLFYQGEMYPEAPQHIYLTLDSKPEGRFLLLGALLGRAEQLKARENAARIQAGNPPFKGRIYTQISPENWDMNGFYAKAGFKVDDSEDLYHFPLPVFPAHAPASCTYASVSLRTPQDVQAFLQRMNAYRMTPLDMDFLAQCMQMEHFLAIGYYRGGNAVCEALLTGQGENVTLVSMYVRKDYRRQGFAKAILGAAADILRPRGVKQVSCRIYSRNPAQVALMRAAAGKKIRSVALLPGISF